MAQHVVAQDSFDSLGRTDSRSSLRSDFTYDSRRSSIQTLNHFKRNRTKHGLFSKLGSSLHSIFHRFSTKYKTLSPLEIQILSTITHFNRDEILQW